MLVTFLSHAVLFLYYRYDMQSYRIFYFILFVFLFFLNEIFVSISFAAVIFKYHKSKCYGVMPFLDLCIPYAVSC